MRVKEIEPGLEFVAKGVFEEFFHTT
jgi:hypothetical protein